MQYRSTTREHAVDLVNEHLAGCAGHCLSGTLAPCSVYFQVQRPRIDKVASTGLLGGALQKATEGRRSDPGRQQQIEQHRPQLEAYEQLCEELGETPADVALAWLLHNPVVTAPIIGPRTLDQLEGSLRALEIQLSAETLAKLDEIWPGLGGGAPEAYAW